MGFKKRYVAICIMLLFLLVGCVAAGDNAASDDVVKASNDNATISVENNVVEEDNSAQGNGSISVENDKENVLGATGDQDVLGDKQTTGGTFTNLYNDFNSGSGTLTFTGNYDAASATDVAGGRADGINIGSYTTIDGTGHHIDAHDLARIFIVPSGTATNHNNVVFQNIVFLNGHRTADTAYGGAIQVNQYADVTFINCTFENCHVSFRGGAIYFAQNTNGKFTNCNFTHNYLETTDYTNDYEQMGGGAIHFFGATDGVEFTDCHFNDNHVRSNYNHDRAYAGAVCFEGTASNNRFVNCSFDSNFCEAIKAGGHRGHPSGGAIYFASAASEISVIECNFTNNYLRGNYSSGIDHDWITYAWGGAICFKNNVEGIIIQKSRFDNNSALSDGPACSSYGGAVCFYSGASDIHITDSDFKDNWVLAQNTRELVNGGGNSAWSRTTGATSYGGAIYFGVSKENTGNKHLDNINIYGCSFDSNHAYKGNRGESMTGAIYFEGETLSTINIHDTVFARNTAQNDYAVINFIVPVSDCELINVTFDHNSGTTAPLYFGDTVSSTNVINCTFTNNTNTKSDGVGGAMYVENAQGILIKGTTFMDNDAESTQGSTLYIKSGDDAQVENCSFINQRITGNGAAIFWGADEDFITHNSNFINNYASLKGAAIYFSHKPNRIEIYDSVFSHNKVQGDNGGALNIPDATQILILKGCTFDSNEASNDGAGVYVSSTALTYASIDNCTFISNNHVNGNGGAIYWGTTSAFNMVKSTFEDNKAQKGATIYFAKTPSSIDIRDSKFIGNEETGDNGGALNIPNGVTSTNIKNCTFDSNRASGDGAAIYVNSGNTNIDNSTFIGNTASSTPYVIYIADSKTSNAISNSKFNGVEQVYVSPNAGVTFTSNNQTSSGADSHVIKNYKGTIGLSKNNFANVILNDNGFITTQTYANVSSNTTYYLDGKYSYPINATIKDDNNNYIISYTFRFATNYGNDYEAADIITHNSTMVTTYEFYRVSGTDVGLTNLHSYNATYWVFPKLGSYTWLQDKIDKLGENGVYVLDINITFDPDYDLSPLNRYYNVINFTNGMLINKSVTIDGNGNTSISGDNQARIFNIAADNVNLKNLEFTKAYTAGNGGALYVKNGVDDLSISDCTFNSNNVKAAGAAIYAEGNNKNIDIEKSSFNANSAYGGGAIQFNAAASQTSDNIKIVSCNFTNNRDLSDDKGGSAVSLNQATSVELTDSKFDGNIAKTNGAVMLDYCSDVVFNACNFSNNRATVSAGAIYIKNSRSGAVKTADITNSVFINNTANDGGAIYSACGGVNVEKSTFINNTATSNGAAIFFNTDFTVGHSSFENNHANGNGTVYVKAIDSSARIVSSNFTKNSAYNGGAIHYVSNEAVPKLTIANDDFINNTASHNGGAVYYIFSDNYYRDYNNFDDRGTYDSGRTSISFMVGSTERVFIANSYFEDNKDYNFEVSSIILNKSAHVVVKLVHDIMSKPHL